MKLDDHMESWFHNSIPEYQVLKVGDYVAFWFVTMQYNPVGWGGYDKSNGPKIALITRMYDNKRNYKRRTKRGLVYGITLKWKERWDHSFCTNTKLVKTNTKLVKKVHVPTLLCPQE